MRVHVAAAAAHLVSVHGPEPLVGVLVRPQLQIHACGGRRLTQHSSGARDRGQLKLSARSTAGIIKGGKHPVRENVIQEKHSQMGLLGRGPGQTAAFLIKDVWIRLQLPGTRV